MAPDAILSEVEIFMESVSALKAWRNARRALRQNC